MIYRPRRAKQTPNYYKTECLDCELIISVKWERAYVGIMPIRSHSEQNICAFCGGTHVVTLKINEKEYIDTCDSFGRVANTYLVKTKPYLQNFRYGVRC